MLELFTDIVVTVVAIVVGLALAPFVAALVFSALMFIIIAIGGVCYVCTVIWQILFGKKWAGKDE